jgi:glycosyltransferase involved in cell wall biosynthesis
MKNKKCLIVGAYPKGPIFGGFVRDCEMLKLSNLYTDYEVIEFDSSQKSNPPAKLPIRMFFAFFRIIRFFTVIFINKFSVAVILFPSGLGAWEKICLGLILNYSQPDAKILFLPRAGRWIGEVGKYPKFVRRRFSGPHVFWLCQGSASQNALRAANANCKTYLLAPLVATEESFTPRTNNYENGLRFLYVGWLEESKGVLDLLMALKLTAENFQLDIVGDGSLQKQVVNAVKSDNRIIFHGWRTKDEVFTFYDTSHCLILPSYIEGFPNTVAEAMMHNCAIVVSDVGDLSGIIDSDQLTKPGCPKQLAHQINLLIRNPNIVSDRCANNLQKSKLFGVHDFNRILDELGLGDSGQIHIKGLHVF